MAKKKAKQRRQKLTKSDAIRAFHIEQPDVGPKGIAKYLNKRGYKVSAQFVSNVLFNDRKKSRFEIKSRAKRGECSASDLLVAKKLVERLGSVKAAKEVIDTYAKLIS